jgi:glycine oxidase
LVKNYDIIIIGGGVIGLSLARELAKSGARVGILERATAGREASYAAAGMIAYLDPVTPRELLPLANYSAQIYSEYVRQLEEESGVKIDFRRNGSIDLSYAVQDPGRLDGTLIRELAAGELAQLEPNVRFPSHAYLSREDCVDPRTLVAALIAALPLLGIELVSGTPALEVLAEHGQATGVRTEAETISASTVINCGGAWAAQIKPVPIPTVPARGHMLAMIDPESPASPALQHVVRTPDCYFVPRSDGRLVVGSTLEPAGFDKRVDPRRIERLRQSAKKFVPAVANMTVQETWTGLRPGTPDSLPILGQTAVRNYYACTGHYRDGILLAPATAHVMAQLITTGRTEFDLERFSPLRFR